MFAFGIVSVRPLVENTRCMYIFANDCAITSLPPKAPPDDALPFGSGYPYRSKCR